LGEACDVPVQKAGKPPRVIQVTTIGITSYRALLAQCRRLRERGVEIGFVFSPSPEGEMLRRQGFSVKEIHIDRKINPWSDLNSIITIYRYLRAVRPDAVHTHTSKAGVVGRLAARLAGVPCIIHTVHGFPFHPGMPAMKRLFFEQIEKWMAGITDLILSQSEEDIAAARRLGIRPRGGDLIHIGNGIDLSEFDPDRYTLRRKRELKKSLNIDENEPVVSLIGRINREKGYHDLVEALQRVEDIAWQALFVGPDEGFLPDLEHLIDRRGLRDRIEILGKRSDIADLLAVTDIFVLPSYREGLPRSLIEAQAMALPCVATNIRGCREVVEEGVTGLLIPPGDVDALAGSLRKLLLDPELRFQMGREGRQRMQRYFDEAEVVRRVMEVYGEVLSDEKNTCLNEQL